MDKKTALNILNQTKATYNEISNSFSQSRFNVWPEFDFLKKYDKQGKVLDFGCGNGRFAALFNKAEYFGIDISEELIKIAKNKFPNKKFYVFDGLNIPFENNFFDFVFSIAVFHHIPSKALRQEVLLELKRVLKPEGLLLISVWDLTTKPKILKLVLKNIFFKIIGKSKLDFLDVWLFWQNKQKRYIHIFFKRFLENEIKQAGFKILKSFALKRGKEKNIIIIAKK